ncbi:non-ribosomal peptide synthetase [Chitiniphilus eburneus]|nr:non-ribosomal peptide synthetase [Chitiniphilus eburneus]
MSALPLTAAQQAIWLGHQFDPQSPAYNVASCIDLRGELRHDLLARALHQAVHDTDVLRTRYAEQRDEHGDSVVRQQVLPEVPVALPLLDLRDDADPTGAARRWMTQDTARRIDLEHGPLFGAALLRLDAHHHQWYFKTHHIALDGFALSMFFRRVAQCYTTLARDQAPAGAPFDTLAALLDDDHAWQASPAFATDREFWRDRCRGGGEVPSLAPDSAMPAHHALYHVATLPAADMARLRALADAVSSHWVPVLVAAFGAFLARATGHRDIVLGVPFLNRLGSVATRVPCSVANVLPLRLSAPMHRSVGQLIEAVGAELAQMRTHQRYRAEDVRRDCNLLGEGRRLTGPQINIDVFSDTLHFDTAQGHADVLSAGPADDLSLLIQPNLDGGGLRIVGMANPALYRQDDLARHVARFLAFLPRFCARPDTPLGRLDAYGDDDLGLFFAEIAKQEPAQAASPDTLVDRFERWAAETPDAIALTLDGEHLSYATLNARANRLAHALAAPPRGAGQPLIALLLARSVETVVSILAVLKAGAGYVPMDPDAPASRIETILDDTRPLLLLADRASAATLGDTPCPVWQLDDPALREQLARQPDTDLPRRAASDDLAYVIYTSGSTGKPKGVCISHRNVVRLFDSTDAWFHYRRDDVWSMCHAYIFDASVWEMWGALLHGGRLLIVPVATTRAPDQLLELIVAEQVTVFGQIPSAFYRFMEAEADRPDLGAQLRLRYQCFGGEALDPARVAPWFDRHPEDRPRLLNMYGITETTVNTTYQFVTAAQARAGNGSLIGRAYADLGLLVLDDALRPVPAGGYGEMYVTGAGLARGYLNRPDLDAVRFVANPYGPPGSRMYRSGDVAALGADGVLEYIGRADQQVKVRGYRIELGEIEAHLRAHPQVSDAVASVRRDAAGDPKLLAHVVPSLAAGGEVDVAALRDYLRERVPPYMVPNALGVLPALPFTLNGKVDRKALPDIQVAGDAHVEPARDALDEQVLACWCSHLAVAQLGIDHNFFEVGGDSIKAIRVCRDLDIPVMTLFDAPTPRASADFLRQRGSGAAPLGQPLLHRFAQGDVAGRLTLLCVPFAGGNAFAFRGLVEGLSARFACVAVNLPGHDVLRPDDELCAIDDVAERVTAEIVASVEGPIVVYGHCAGNAVALAIARKLERDGAALAALVIGGMLPDQDPLAVRDRVATQSGQDIIAFLRSIGGFQEALDEESLAAIARITKHDADQTADFFANDLDARVRLRAPIHVVVGDADPLTPDYATRYLDWQGYADAVSLSVIADGGHYFVSDQPLALAQVLEQRYGALGHAATVRAPRTLRDFHNPFDDDSARFLLLGNAAGQRSLWPAFTAAPDGWAVRFGPAAHADCLARLRQPDSAVPTPPGLDAPYWPADFAAAYRAKGYWTGATLGGMLRRHATQTPERLAVVDATRRLSYAELDLNADRLASGFAELGLGAGDRVVVQLPNSVAFVEVVFALFRLGAIPVFALPSDRLSEIGHIVTASGAVAYVIQDKAHGCDYRALARALQPTAPALRHVIVAGDAEELVALDTLYGAPAQWPERDAREAALITLSGGSTALPKLILRRHDDYLYSIRASADLCGLDRDSVYLCALPAGHNFALSSPGFLGALYAGGLVVMTADPSPASVFATIERERVSVAAAVPSLALAWLHAERAHDLSSLRLLQIGGASLGKAQAAALADAFPGALQQVYGMSEGLVCYTRPGDAAEQVQGSQGLPISADDEIRIVDEHDQPVPDGTPGQLLVRGPYTIRGYLNAPGHNAVAFTPDGFYRTGDVVRRRTDGYLVVTGRIKDQVNRGGEKIAAEEVESHLLTHPQVREAAIVGMPDGYLGEVACAFIVLAPQQQAAPPALAASLKSFLRERGIAAFKVPDLIRFVPALPKTTLGKTDKKALRARLAE